MQFLRRRSDYKNLFGFLFLTMLFNGVLYAQVHALPCAGEGLAVIHRGLLGGRGGL